MEGDIIMTGKMANRADLIIKILMTQSGASIKELSAHLGVSEITIRRDLHVLERQGRLRLINGVAVYRAPVEAVSVYPEYDLAYEYTIFQQKRPALPKSRYPFWNPTMWSPSTAAPPWSISPRTSLPICT